MGTSKRGQRTIESTHSDRPLWGRASDFGRSLKLPQSILLLRLSIGVVYFWFGALKFKLGASPAEALALHTIDALTGSMLNPELALRLLASWECLVGVLLLTGRYLAWAMGLLLLHMAGPLLTLFLFPRTMFTHFPYAPTMEGQYVIKNLVLIAGALVVGLNAPEGRPTREMTPNELGTLPMSEQRR